MVARVRNLVLLVIEQFDQNVHFDLIYHVVYFEHYHLKIDQGYFVYMPFEPFLCELDHDIFDLIPSISAVWNRPQLKKETSIDMKN